MNIIRSSLFLRITISVILVVSIIFFISLFSIQRRTYDILFEITENTLLKEADSVSNKINEFFSRNNFVVKEMAVNRQIINFLNDVKNRDEIKLNDNYNDIIKTLSDIQKLDERIALVWIADFDSSYVISHNEWNSPADWYITQRDWYKDVMKDGDFSVTEPYVDAVTGKMVVSIVKAIRNENSDLIGFAAIDLMIDYISEFLKSYNFGESGYVFLMTKDKRILYHSGRGDSIRLSEFKDNYPDIVENMSDLKSGFDSFYYEDIKKFIGYAPILSNGWSVGAILREDEFNKNIESIRTLILYIDIVGILLLFAVLYLVLHENLKDIKRLILKVEDYSQGKKNIDFYIDSKDEIGKLSKALSNMQFVIDKQNRDLYKANKILKDINEEVYEKNEMLTASEEELKAQLQEIQAQNEEIDFLANHDSLTNLPNRRKFMERVNRVMNRGKKGSIILMDIDNFKVINDTKGHVYGDEVLKELAKILESFDKENIFVSRFGGDEFLILLEDLDNPEFISVFIEELKNKFEKIFFVDGYRIEIKFSIGISIFPKDSKDINQLIMYADLALYEVKSSGKNGYRFFDMDMINYLLNKSNIDAIIKQAIENDGFKILYQPQINIKTGEVNTFEALIRFKNHNISPSSFIPISEENGSIIKIGRIVTQKVIEQLSLWKRRGVKIIPVSINFSPLQLHDNEYFNFLMEQLSINDISPNFIEIEITENVFLNYTEQTLNLFNRLRNKGIKISIDDFGTGYSSLSYLTNLPIDKVKLDKSVNDKFLRLNNIRVMDSLIMLVHSLNLEVVAEGIEDYEQIKRLKVGNCDLVQGYYFSKPVDVSEVENLLKENIFYDKLRFGGDL